MTKQKQNGFTGRARYGKGTVTLKFTSLPTRRWTSIIEQQAFTEINNRMQIDNMLRTAQHLHYVQEMICAPYLLNVQNGVVDLRTRKLKKHDQKYLCTTLCNVEYNPVAKSRRFKSFIDEVFEANQDVMRYVRTMFGYDITGERREEKIFFLFGEGGNGKSKLIDAVRSVVGENSSLIPITALTKSHNSSGQPTPELVPLIGARMAFSSEIKGEDKVNDSSVKQLTGNKELLTRKMRKEFTNTLINAL